MINKSNLESKIKKDLIQKASEIKLSDEMISIIIDRIENDEGGNQNMLKDRISNVMLKRYIAVSLCAILAFTGILFTFSEETRAFALEAVNTIKTIFVLQKLEGEYKIVEKLTIDPILEPVYSSTSKLSDEEISEKLGFNVSYPERLSGEYKFRDKMESVGILRKVSKETQSQLEDDMLKAINDDAAFDGLSEYKPYRYVFAIYTNKEGKQLFIGVQAAEVPLLNENVSNSIKTSVGNKEADWTEIMYPDYDSIMEKGIGRSDLHKKPERIVKLYSLKWESDGVRYDISVQKGQEFSMEEAVKIAESFMEQMK